MVITATELKTNLGKYLTDAAKEETIVTKNGKPIIRLVPYRQSRVDTIAGLLDPAVLPEDFDGDYKSVLQELRRKDYEDLD